jgi:hypothetical protein
MLGKLLGSRFKWMTQLTALSEESDEERLQRSSLIIASLIFIPAGVIWGMVYLAYGEAEAAMIPLGYSLFSLISLPLAKQTFRGLPRQPTGFDLVVSVFLNAGAGGLH